MHLPLVTSILAFTIGSLPAQNDCLDQQFVPVPLSTLEVTQNQSVTQTFTVGIAGRLSRIDIVGVAHQRGVTARPLDVAIVTTLGGVPTDTVVAALSVPSAAIPSTPSTITLDVSGAGARVRAGEVLGLRLSTTAPAGGPSYAWEADVPSNYDGGEVFINRTTPLPWDMGFRTRVAVTASRTSYGQGHPGNLGIPSLGAIGQPMLGTTIRTLIGNSRGVATSATMLIGFIETSAPTAFDGTLLVVPSVAVAVTLSTTGGEVPLKIPADANLCGKTMSVQCLLFDPAASRQVSFTAGMRLTLGY